MIAANAPVVWFDVIDSTNEEAVRRAQRGVLDPVWIEAGSQTAGRGRRGRAWLSAPGNVFVTYLGVTNASPQKTALLGLSAAVGVADAIDALGLPGATRLKWPNDVLIGSAKVCGILLESGKTTHDALWFALGVGINCASAPEGADYPIASLKGAGLTRDPQDVRSALREHLCAVAQTLQQEGFGPIRGRWLARAHGLGLPVRAVIGQETIVGVAIDLSEDGALRVETPDGRNRSISAGEVYFTQQTSPG